MCSGVCTSFSSSLPPSIACPCSEQGTSAGAGAAGAALPSRPCEVRCRRPVGSRTWCPLCPGPAGSGTDGSSVQSPQAGGVGGAAGPLSSAGTKGKRYRGSGTGVFAVVPILPLQWILNTRSGPGSGGGEPWVQPPLELLKVKVLLSPRDILGLVGG